MRIEHCGDTVSAVVPGGFRGSAAGWGIATLLLWGATALPALLSSLVSDLVGAPGAPPVLFSGMTLAFAPFAVYGVYLLLWAIGGSEEVVCDEVRLVLRRRLMGIPMPSREYDLAQVERIRVGPLPYMTAWSPWGPVLGGTVAFDYGASTVRFAVGLPRPEAAELARALGGAG